MSPAAQYEFLVALVLAIFVLELVARRMRLPPAAAFIMGGAALAVAPGLPTLAIDPDLILLVFLPPLLMNGAFFTAWREFRDNLGGILLLAVGAVAFTTLTVGVAAHLLAPLLPWAVCFALGALLSPPDAVAAEAVLERLSLPARLGALLAGESLLNDATGLVLFRFAVAAALTGAFSTTAALGAFAVLTMGGIAFGLVVGQAGLSVIRRLPDSELAITATLLLTLTAYAGGEWIGVSGVLATVTSGLVLGWHQHSVFTAGTRMRAGAFWRVLVFLLESLLFILIGLSLRGVLARLAVTQDGLASLVLPVAGIMAAVVLSRFAWMFGGDLLRRLARRLGWRGGAEPSFAVAGAMSWAGMRGVVSLAAALSLPEHLPGRDLALACAFAVILVTVLLQGVTLGPLISLLRLTGPERSMPGTLDEDRAWRRMTDAQFLAITVLSRSPDGSERHPRLLEQYRHRAEVAAATVVEPAEHQSRRIEHFRAVITAIDAGRAMVLRMHRAGEIHDRVLRDLEQELDLQQLVAESHLG